MSLNPFGGGDADSAYSDEESALSQPTSPRALRRHLEAPLDDVQREKLERQRMYQDPGAAVGSRPRGSG